MQNEMFLTSKWSLLSWLMILRTLLKTKKKFPKFYIIQKIVLNASGLVLNLNKY